MTGAVESLHIPPEHERLRMFAATLLQLSSRHATDTFDEFCAHLAPSNGDGDWRRRSDWLNEVLDASGTTADGLATAYHEAGRLDFEAFCSQTALHSFSDVLERVYLDPIYPALEAVDFMFDPSAASRLRFSVAAIVELEKPPALACDIGIGSGDILLALMEALPDTRFVCIDVSQPVWRFVERRLQRRGLRDRVEFYCGDIRALPLAANLYDLTVANEVIEHVQESALAIRECARVTRTGGRAIISTSMRYPSTVHLGEFPSARAFERSVRDAGLRMERLDIVENALSEHSFVDLFALARKN